MSEHKMKRRDFLLSSGIALSALGTCHGSDDNRKLLATPNDLSTAQVGSGEGPRDIPVVKMEADFIVVGGGIAGTCAAITAARAGMKVILVQDRPVLGGNASSEVRLWILGATSHMNNNNRWSREGGVLEELLVENLYRNREGNTIFLDALLLEKVWAEPNISLLLNTAVDALEMLSPDKIDRVSAYCSQNSTRYELKAPMYCDTSGDGILGFLSGAAFRVGAETAEEFGEKFIMPDDYGRLLGHSMYFYSKDTGHPVKYVPPAFALKDIPKNLPAYRRIQRDSSGCRLWWLEWGDDLDRVFDSEKIKEELWRVVYGVWDYIKNSGTFDDVDNLTLEWVGTIPGKRESRRFEGDYILRQQDIVEQRHFKDTIAYGGWAIDLHPGKGVYSSYPCCTQYHSKGIYEIPYRTIYSRNISNLFFGGRLISASHVAFGSTRVIATGTLCAQAAAWAAVLCHQHGILPREIRNDKYMDELQRLLMQSGQYIPALELLRQDDLISSAELSASSTLELGELPPNEEEWRQLNFNTAMLLPFSGGKIPAFTFKLRAEEATTLNAGFYVSSRPENFTPDQLVAERNISVEAGTTDVVLNFDAEIEEPHYGFVILRKNSKLCVPQSDTRITGILSLFNRHTQKENSKHGVEEVPFYSPERRPKGKNIACNILPPLKNFGTDQLQRGFFRPASNQVNAWIAAIADRKPHLTAQWKDRKSFKKIILWFDTDFDHSMESCLMGHPEDVVPFCVRSVRLFDDSGRLIHEISENYHSRYVIDFDEAVQTTSLMLEFQASEENIPVALFGWQVFA